MSSTRITTDLGDPNLLKLLKYEAQATNTNMREVVVRALEAYFNHRLETRALQQISESIFEDWDDPRDSDYDTL